MTTGPGTISVSTSEGTSNTIPFYCRALGDNHIYFISRDGSDSYNGFSATHTGGTNGPWFSAPKVKELQAGDVAYFRSGIWSERDPASPDNPWYNSVLYFPSAPNGNGVENKSITIASYPGEFAQLGSKERAASIRRVSSNVMNYWTFSKFILRGSESGISWRAEQGSEDNLRVIGNDASTYGPAGGSVVLSFSGNRTNLYLYGNNSHDAGVDKRGDKADDNSRSLPIYMSGYGFHNYIYIGWNEFAYNENGRVQFYGHVAGDWMDNLYFHNNYVHHNGREGVVLGGSDGDNGKFLKTVYFYNNIVAFNGTRAGYAFTASDDSIDPSGDYYIYNNTFYQNNTGELYFWATLKSTVFKNNIIWANSGKKYYSYYSGASDSGLTGSNNCYYNGTDGIPGWDQNSIEQNPQLVDPNNYDFQLLSDSPCIDIGTSDVSGAVTMDYNRISRPQGAGYDVGAYEYIQAPLIPNLILTKSADVSTAKSGDIITYTISYQNIGTGDAKNVVITDPIPQGATYETGSADATGGSFDSTQVVWNIGEVKAGGSGNVGFQVRVE